MTQPSTPPSTAVLTRRQGLFALALATTGAAIAACSSPSTPAPPTAPPSSATPQSETIRLEQELISKYDVAIAGVPTIAAALTALRDQHVDHITALGGTASTASAPAGAVAGFPGPSAGQSAIIQALLEAERVAATERIEACVAATDATLARILTFIAASESSHLPALKDLQA
jgi:hypothetical protein